MEAAFLLQVTGRPGSSVDPGRPDDDVLAFSSGERHTWTDTAGRLRVDTWRGGDRGATPWWDAPDGSLGAVVGHVRQRGRTWSAPGAWAQEVASLGAGVAAADLCHRLRGMFGALVVTPDGDGWLAADPLGYRCLYVAEEAGRLVVASRAALAAAVVGGAGAGRRDPEAAAWQAYTTYHVGDRSGFEGVRVVRPGSVLRLSAGRPAWERLPHPLLEPEQRPPIEDVAALLIEEVTESLLAASSLPAERRILNLTGGRDSRLVLAVALRAGVHQDFEYETTGPPKLADVMIAEELAAQLGLRHQTRFIGTRQPGPFSEVVRGFVERTGGLVNAWDRSAPAPPGELRLTGICGESFRSFRRSPRAVDHPEALRPLFGAERFGRTGLLREDVAERLHAELLTDLATRPDPHASPSARLHGHYLANRVRFARLGPRDELHQAAVRYQPLHSWDNVALTRMISDEDRDAAVLVAEALRQCSELLTRHRFASGGWDERATAHLDRRPPGPATPAGADRPRAAGPTRPPDDAGPPADQRSLMDHLSTRNVDEREQFLDDVLTVDDGPAWTVLDPDRVRRSLGRWSELPTPERRELFGAATVAIWSGGGPTADPPGPGRARWRRRRR